MYKFKSLTNSVACVPANFGGDPIVGVAKICEYAAAGVPLPTPTSTRTPTKPTATRTTVASPALTSVTARLVQNAHVQIRWTTRDETQITGFNVWRRVGGQPGWKKINPEIVSAQFAGQSVGGRYHNRDHNISASTTYLYKLEILYAANPVDWSDVVKVKVP